MPPSATTDCSDGGWLSPRRAASSRWRRTRSAWAAAALGSDASVAERGPLPAYRAVGRTSVISVGCWTGGAALLPSCTATSALPVAAVMLGVGVVVGGAMYGVNEAYPAACAAAVAGVGVDAEGAPSADGGAGVVATAGGAASAPGGASRAARRWPELESGKPEAGSAALPCCASDGMAFNDCS